MGFPDASDSKAGPLPPALIGKLVFSASELVRIRLIGGHFCHTYGMHYIANKDPSSQSDSFSNSHV